MPLLAALLCETAPFRRKSSRPAEFHNKRCGVAFFFTAALLCGTPAFADDYALPDPGMTPGAVDTTQEVFCHRKAKERRSRKATAICAAVFDAYNIPRDPIVRAGHQCDHLIPLSAGGATSAANLWPEPYPEASFKDVCDRAVHNLVCAGKLTAADVYRDMAADWPSACAKYLGR